MRIAWRWRGRSHSLPHTRSCPFADIVESLYQHLPEGAEHNIFTLRENIRSPQFSQALASFSHALQTGQLDAVMGQFGVSPVVAQANGGGASGLCEAIQKEEDAKKAHGEGPN